MTLRTNCRYRDAQTSVILQNRLCQPPSRGVGDSLKSFVPRGPPEREGGDAREGGWVGQEGSEEDQRRRGRGGKRAAERIHYIICVPLFCLSSHSLAD